MTHAHTGTRHSQRSTVDRSGYSQIFSLAVESICKLVRLLPHRIGDGLSYASHSFPPRTFYHPDQRGIIFKSRFACLFPRTCMGRSSVIKQQYQAMFAPELINIYHESPDSSAELEELLDVIPTINLDSIFQA
jgi:hypothetical protein